MGDTMLCIGTMSGTSMDGIDVALIKTDGKSNITELGHFSMTYDPRFKFLLHVAQYCIHEAKGYVDKARKMFENSGIQMYLENEMKKNTKENTKDKKEAIEKSGIEDHWSIDGGMIFNTPEAEQEKIKRKIAKRINASREYLFNDVNSSSPITLDKVIEHSTYLHGKAVEELLQQTNRLASEIGVLGYHGQTMDHQPSASPKYSIIVGNGQQLADMVQIPVVNDFRARDVDEGGKGAPFAPLYHLALAERDKQIPAVVVNCGGIANISVIRSDNPEDLIGFDTGPGNGLIDRLVRQRTNSKVQMDENGQYGAQGQVNQKAFNALCEKSIIMQNGENYFHMLPPKALDISDLKLVDELDDLTIQDACATLEAFTAHTIVESVVSLRLDPPPKTFILAGGGWNNPVILNELENRLKETFGAQVKVMTADQAGWNSQAMEAQIFAHFAMRSLQGLPISYPNTTGVPIPLSGGKIYLPAPGSFPIVEQYLSDNSELRDGYAPLQSARQLTPV